MSIIKYFSVITVLLIFAACGGSKGPSPVNANSPSDGHPALAADDRPAPSVEEPSNQPAKEAPRPKNFQEHYGLGEVFSGKSFLAAIESDVTKSIHRTVSKHEPDRAIDIIDIELRDGNYLLKSKGDLSDFEKTKFDNILFVGTSFSDPNHKILQDSTYGPLEGSVKLFGLLKVQGKEDYRGVIVRLACDYHEILIPNQYLNFTRGYAERNKQLQLLFVKKMEFNTAPEFNTYVIQVAPFKPLDDLGFEVPIMKKKETNISTNTLANLFRKLTQVVDKDKSRPHNYNQSIEFYFYKFSHPASLDNNCITINQDSDASFNLDFNDHYQKLIYSYGHSGLEHFMALVSPDNECTILKATNTYDSPVYGTINNKRAIELPDAGFLSSSSKLCFDFAKNEVQYVMTGNTTSAPIYVVP